MENNPKTPLIIGNEALRQGRLEDAINYFVQAVFAQPELVSTLTFNISLARARLSARGPALPPMRAVVSTQLASAGSPARQRAIADMLQFEGCEHIVFDVPEEQGVPARVNAPSATHRIVLNGDGADALRDMALFVADHRYQTVYLGDDCIASFLLGVLFKQLWGAQVVSVAGRPQQGVAILPSLEHLRDEAWRATIPAMAEAFDGLPGTGECHALSEYAHTLVRKLRSPLLSALVERPVHSAISQPIGAAHVVGRASVTGSQYYSARWMPPARPLVWLKHADLAACDDAGMIELGGQIIGLLEDQFPVAAALPRKVACQLHRFAQLNQIQPAKGLFLRRRESISPIDAGAVHHDAALHAFVELDVDLAAAWYCGDRELRLHFNTERLQNAPLLVMRAYQYDPSMHGGLVLVGEAPVAPGGAALAELSLINTYLPILLLLSGADGTLFDAAFLPFPSLLPGGMHAVETSSAQSVEESAMQAALRLAEDFFAQRLVALNTSGAVLGELLVDLRAATGGERIFSIDFKEWIWSIFNIRLRAWRPTHLDDESMACWTEMLAVPFLDNDAERFVTQVMRERSNLRMICPHDGIPTLCALTAGDAERAEPLRRGDYLIAKRGGTSKGWRVTTPAWGMAAERAFTLDGSIRYPFVGHHKKTAPPLPGPGAPVAIVERAEERAGPLELVMPYSLDSGPVFPLLERPAELPQVHVLITARWTDISLFGALLESLRLQTDVHIASVVVAPPYGGAGVPLVEPLRRYFPGNGRLIAPEREDSYTLRVRRAVEASDTRAPNAKILFIDQPCVVHDPRTISSLAGLLGQFKVGTAGCMLIARSEPAPAVKVEVRFSGWFACGPERGAGATWSSLNGQALFPRSTYSVASNGSAFFMISAEKFHAQSQPVESRAGSLEVALALSASLAAAGLVHLHSTSLSVELTEPVSYTEPTEQPAPREERVSASSTHLLILPA